jgi:hypothetical protein
MGGEGGGEGGEIFFMIYGRAKGGEMIPRNFFIKAKS